MINLSKILTALYDNQTKVAEFLGINRGTLRCQIKDKNDFVVIGNKVYKEVSRINIDAINQDEIKRLELRKQFEMECNIR